MIFNVLRGPGLSNNSLKSGDRLAVQRQTDQEHQELLDPSTLPGFQTAMSMPPGPQRELALAALRAEAEIRESQNPKYWDDQLPRRPISQSSSWIDGIQYDPNSQIMTVLTNGKTIARGGVSPSDAASLVDSPSIGQAVIDKYF